MSAVRAAGATGLKRGAGAQGRAQPGSARECIRTFSKPSRVSSLTVVYNCSTPLASCIGDHAPHCGWWIFSLMKSKNMSGALCGRLGPRAPFWPTSPSEHFPGSTPPLQILED